MARSYRPVRRDQAFLLPPDMGEWLPEDHLAWVVLEVVEQIDTSAFHASRRLGGAGRAGFDPDMLLAVLVYAYCVGERSSRRIEQLCTEHVAFRVLCASDTPDHSTIARFRSQNKESFKDLFAQVLRVCAQAGMVKVGTVSIDGTKIAAHASRSANRSRDWVREQARKIAEEAVEQAEEVDAAEDAAAPGRTSRAAGPLARRAGRARRIAAAADQVKAQDEAEEEVSAEADAADQQESEQFLDDVANDRIRPGKSPAGVDPVALQQARVARSQKRLASVEGVKGTQASCVRREARKHLKQAERALAELGQQSPQQGPVDTRGRRRRAYDRAATRLGRKLINLTDFDSRLMHTAGGGAVQGYNAQVAVSDDHVVLGVHLSQEANDQRCLVPTLAIATEQAAKLGKDIELLLADAGYFSQENLTAPGPPRLIAHGTRAQVEQDAKEPPGTEPDPPPDLAPDDPRELMRQQLAQPENAQRYKRRGATVEPTIGHLKDLIGLRQFLLRGRDKAEAELHLAATALNLVRYHGQVTA